MTQDPVHEVEFADSDGDGQADAVSWKVPQLSEQTYVVKENENKITEVYVEAQNGQRADITPEIIEKADGLYGIKLGAKKNFRAGAYKLVIVSGDKKEEIWFNWGLISINTRRSIYHPGETAEIIMVVLDKYGYLVKEADVTLEITSPSGDKTTLTTAAGEIIENGPGVYTAAYDVKEEGEYALFAKRNDMANVEIASYFDAAAFYEFDIIRNTPVTIDPTSGPFESNITVKAYVPALMFTFKEYLPREFEVFDTDAIVTDEGEYKVLTWKNVTDGSTVSYEFNVPPIWPYLYAMGPAKVIYSGLFGEMEFTEARPWMLAIDPTYASYYPSGYSLVGDTDYISGTITNLNANDGSYMTFRPYYTFDETTNTREAMITYRSNTLGDNDQLHYKLWNGSIQSWGSEQQMNDVGGTITGSKVVYCPRSSRYYEKIAVAYDAQANPGSLDAFVWNGTGWTDYDNIFTNMSLNQDDAVAWDIAYESLSGDAMFIYGRNFTTSYLPRSQIGYKTWNGSAWSSEMKFNLSTDLNAFSWIDMVPDPNSDYIAVVMFQNSVWDRYALIWNGTNFISNTTLTTTGGAQNESAQAIAWEETTGDAMFVWGINTASIINYTKYSKTTGWGEMLTATKTEWGSDLNFIKMKTRPGTDYMMLAGVSDNYDLDTMYWDGTSWDTTHLEHDSGVGDNSDSSYNFDFAWHPDGSNYGVLVWSSNVTNSLNYSVWDTGAWMPSNASYSGVSRAMQFIKNPRYTEGDVLMLGWAVNITSYTGREMRYDGDLQFTANGTVFSNNTNSSEFDRHFLAFSNFGDPNSAQAVVEFVGTGENKPWDAVNVSVDARSTIAGNVTIQVFNFLTGAYPSSGNGYTTQAISSGTDTMVNRYISTNANDYKNDTYNWKVKVTFTNTTYYDPFNFSIDYIVFNATIPDLYPTNVTVHNNVTAVYSTLFGTGDPLDIRVNITNSKPATPLTGNLTINITNSTGYSFNVSRKEVTWAAAGSTLTNMTNISTAGWNTGSYNVNVSISWYDGAPYSTSVMYYELFNLTNLTARIYPSPGLCLGEIDNFNVTIVSNWTSTITFNISRVTPSNFTVSPVSKLMNASFEASNTTNFTVTVPATAGRYTIYFNVSYRDPNNYNKSFIISKDVYVPSPRITVYRETPPKIANATNFNSSFVIHNLECGPAQDVYFVEHIPSGWSVISAPGNYSINTRSDGITDITWYVPYLGVNEFQMVNYTTLSPSSITTATFGKWNTSYHDIDGIEYNSSEASTYVVTSDTYDYAHFYFTLTMNETNETRVLPTNVSQWFIVTGTNVGRATAATGEWNFTVKIPTGCNVTNNGTATSWDAGGRTLNWTLNEDVPVGGVKNFTFKLNCTQDANEYDLLPTTYSIQTGELEYTDSVSYTDYGGSTTRSNFYHPFTPAPTDSARITRFVWYLTNVALDAGEYCRFWLFNDSGTGNLTIKDNWVGTGGTQYSQMVDEDPADYNKEQFTTLPNHELHIQIYAQASSATAEYCRMTSIMYRWNWGGYTTEQQGMFFKVRRNTEPKISAWNVTPAQGQWGQPFNFTIKVYDQRNDTINVSLWSRQAGTSTWSMINFTQTTNSISNQSINFTQRFSCADADKQYEYKIRAEDPYYFRKETPVGYYNVTRDNVIFDIISGHGSGAIANRSSERTNLTLRLRIRDENGSYLQGLNTTLYISQLGTLGGTILWDGGQVFQTNAAGNITYNFTAADHCDNESTPYTEEEYEVGPHWWYVKINSNEVCYKQTNSTVEAGEYGYYNFTTIGELINTIVAPTGGTIIQQGRANVSIMTYIYNFCEEAMKINTTHVTFNLSTVGASYLCSSIQRIGENVYTCTWQTLNRTNGMYNFTMKSYEDNYYNDTVTEVNAVEIRTVPMLRAANATYRTESWSRMRNYSVNVTDNLDDTVNVTLWLAVGAIEESYGSRCCGPNCPSNPVNCTNVVLNWTNIELNTSKPCETYADKTVRFYFSAEDTETYTYDTSVAAGDYIGNSDTINMEKANTTIEYVEGNNSFTGGAPVWFKLRVNDTDNGSSVYIRPSSEHPLIYFNVTTDENEKESFVYVNDTRTDSAGYANVTFTPDGRFSLGNMTWRGYVHPGDLCYKYNISNNFTVEIFLNWPPMFANMSVNNKTTDSKGWGGGWNFSVEVKDHGSEGGSLNVTLQLDTKDGWRNIETKNCTSCLLWTNINFTDVRLNCSDLNSSARFRFNVTDNANNENGTGVYGTFGVLPDSVAFEHVRGNNTIANRSGSQSDLLVLRLYDQNNNTYLPAGANATLWVSWNYFAYDDGLAVKTNATGHINRSFDPTCDSESDYEYEARNQIWRAQVNSSDTCYYPNISSTYYLNVMGDLNLTIIKPDGSNNYTWGDNVFVQGQLKDDCGNTLDYANVEFNMSVGSHRYNYSNVPNLGGGFYQGDWNSAGAAEGWYNVTMWANKTYQPNPNYSYYYVNQTTIVPPYTFYLKTIPILKYANVTPRLDGWGAVYNFSVNVTDEAGDNVTVIFERKKYGVDYSQVGSSQSCISCTNYTMHWNETYMCANLSGNPTFYFQFTGTDEIGNERKTQTATGDYVNNDNTYVLDKDDVQILYFAGNESKVNRSGGNFTLSLIINDTDRRAYVSDSEATAYLNISTNSSNPNSQNLTEAVNITDGTGHVNFDFSLKGNCNYQVGKQQWYGYVGSADTCYKTAISPSFNITVFGDLNASIRPDNYTKHQEENVYIYVNITDECGHLLSGLNISVLMVKNSTLNYTCGDIVDYNNGTYRCNWTTTQAMPVYKYGVWIQMNSTGYYNNDTELHNDVVWLQSYINNAPVFSSPSFMREGWGAATNFSVHVDDPDYNNVTVWFWTSDTGSEPWTLRNYTNCTLCANTYVNFSLFHNCSFLGNTYYFKFNGTDMNYSGQYDLSGTSSSQTYDVEKDNVSVSFVAGSNNVVNRSGTQFTNETMITRVYDTDNKTYVGSGVYGKLWIRYNVSAGYDGGLENTTDGSGYLRFNFNPGCGYTVGFHNWTSGTTVNTCYDEENMTTPSNLTIIGELIHTFDNASCGGKDYCLDGENVTIYINISDDCNVSVSDASMNISVSHDVFSANCSSVQALGSGRYNCTLNMTSLPGGYYNVTAASARTYFNANSTKFVNAFFRQVAPSLNNENVDPSSTYWARTVAGGPNFAFHVNVSDDDDTLTLELWEYKNSTSGPWQLANSTVLSDSVGYNATRIRTYYSSDIGIWYWKFNVTDQRGLTYETANHTLEVTKRALNISLLAGNESNVTSVGTNSTELAVSVKDAVDGQNVTLPTYKKFWVTTNGVSWGPAQDISIPGFGYMNRIFEPDCPTYYTGRQLWKAGVAGHTQYYDANSSSYVLYIYSQMYLNVTYPNNVSFVKDSWVLINGTIIDECRNVSAATVKFISVNQYGTDISPPCTANNYTGGIYNCTQDMTGEDFGLNAWYNITMNASLAYYNTTSMTFPHRYRLASYPDLTSPEVDPPGEGWGYNYSFNVTVNDQDSGDVVNVSFWSASASSGPWTFRGSQNWTSDQNDHKFEYRQAFTCSDYTADSNHRLYYKYNVTDTINFTDETSPTNFIELQKDDVWFANVTGSGITINREGTDTGRIGVQVYDDDSYSKNKLGSGIMVSFWLTNDSANYAFNLTNTTNASGYVFYDFEPTCSYAAGSQLWFGGTENSTCYKMTNQSQGSQSLVVRGQFKNNLQTPANGTRFNVTNGITVRFNISTDCSNEGIVSGATTKSVTLIHNQTGATSSCVTVNDEGNGWYNCTWSSTGQPEGNWSINVTTGKNDYNPNTTVWLNRFFLDNRGQAAENQTFAPSQGGWGTTYTYNISIADPEGDTVTCVLWTNTTGSGWINRGSSAVAGSGNCSVQVSNFNYTDVGASQYRFAINDTYNALETANFSGPVINNDSVTVIHSAGNNTNVNRSMDQTTLLGVRVNDTDNGQPTSGIDTTFWVSYTNNSVDYDTGFLNQTSSDGYSYYSFNATCGYTVGVHNWKAGVTDGMIQQD